MKTGLAITAVGLVALGSTASAQGITYLHGNLELLGGEVSDGGVTDTFQGGTRFDGDIVFEEGPITLYGGLSFDREDFTGEGGPSDDLIIGTYYEIGGEYEFGPLSFGVNSSSYLSEEPAFDFEATAISSAVYAVYRTETYYVGGALHRLEIEDTFDLNDVDDRGLAVFGGYDIGRGLAVGGQISDYNGDNVIQLYAAYDIAPLEISFDLSNSEFETFYQLDWSFDIAPRVEILAGLLTVNTDDDETAETYVGASYAWFENVKLRGQLYSLQAFNEFEGSGVLIGVTYETGTQRRGYMSYGAYVDQLYSPAFYRF